MLMDWANITEKVKFVGAQISAGTLQDASRKNPFIY